MDGLFTVIVFLVIAALSIVSKAQEKRKIDERKKLGKSAAPLPEATRRVIFGDEQAQAEASRGAPPEIPATPQRSASSPRPVVQEILESLLGVELDEGQWQAVEPAPRRELPPKLQEVAQHPGHTETPRNAREALREQRQHSGADHAQHKRRQAPPPAPPRQRSQRSTRQGGKVQPARHQRRQQPEQQAVPTRRSTPIFSGLGDVRKAIVFAEVLGPPKAFRQDNDLWH